MKILPAVVERIFYSKFEPYVQHFAVIIYVMGDGHNNVVC